MPALKIVQIERSGGTQIRSQYTNTTIDRYKELWEARVELPAVIVFYDGTKYWLADGFHRVEAKWLAELPLPQAMREIECDVRSGEQRDAIKFALSANSDHGLPRTGDDIRRAIARCLDDEEWSQLSNVAISKMCACSESMVRKVKGERESPPAFNDPESADLLVLPNNSASSPTKFPSATPKQFEPTLADPETAEVGEVLAISKPDLLVNKSQEFWDAVPDLQESLFDISSATQEEIAPCEFKIGDRVIDIADDRAGVVVGVFRRGGNWQLKVDLDTGYGQNGAVELYRLEPRISQPLLCVYILARRELGGLVATYTKAKGYQYHKLQDAIGQNNLVMSGVRSVIQSIADKEGGVVKKMIVTIED